MRERLQKIISAYGLASRRSAERMIADGLVCVNGEIAKIGDSADPDIDVITVKGIVVEKQPERICIALHKPEGYLTTVSDSFGRKTIMELLGDVEYRIYPAGRLDMNSSGLLILTNDGQLANKIMHPASEKNKIYHVTVKGDIHKALPILNSAMLIDGYKIRPARTVVLKEYKGSVDIEMTIHEGRNRQIRKMCAQTNLKVIRLHRVAIGGVALGDLPEGKWRNLTQAEIDSLI